MKKNLKLLIVAIFSLLLFNSSAFAKTFSIDELGKKIRESYDNKATFAYIIGNHAFTITAERSLTLQDTMIGSRSMNLDAKFLNDYNFNSDINSDEYYNAINIYQIRYDSKSKTWIKGNNLIGKDSLTDNIDIKYINYNYIKEDTKASFGLDFDKSKNADTYKTLVETTYGFTGGNATNTKDLEYKDGKLKGFLKLFNGELTGAGFSKEEMKGYYFSFFAEFENKDLISDDSTITIKILNKTGQEKPNSAKTFKKPFDSDLGIAMLFAYNPDSEYQTIEVTLDYDGEKEKYNSITYTMDLSELTVQSQTTATVSIDESIIPQSEKLQLKNWNYTLLNQIKLSTDNSHKNGALKYNQEDGSLTGTIFEQKLTGGFVGKDLDSYFFTFTIKPKTITDDIKVKIKNGNSSEKVFTHDDFVEGVLTVLQHIPLESEEPKTITITVDSDGDQKESYLESKEYTIDYSKVDCVDLHKVTINNNDGKTLIDSIDIYDGEKLTEPAKPEKENTDTYEYEYSTFDHWNKQTGDHADSSSDSEFEFTEKKSNEPIKEDITLYPIWEIDVDQYITDSLKTINDKGNENQTFKIENSGNENTFNVEILNRDKKISEITETGLADTIAHALASGEIDTIEFSFSEGSGNRNEVEFKANGETDESQLKEKVKNEIKDFFNKEVAGNSDSQKTLSDLYDAWQKDTDKNLEITVHPNSTVAELKDLSKGAGKVYNVTIDKEFMITFDAGVLTDPVTQYLKKGENLTDLPEVVIPENEKLYRTFAGWYKEDELVSSLNDVKTDEKLVAHYKLNVDKFLEEVVKDLNSSDTTHSNDFTGEFTLDKNENNITINVEQPNLLMSKLADTSIPGTIAYILEKGEIKDITLSVDSQSKNFTKEYKANNDKSYTDNSGRKLLTSEGKDLKKEIVEGAKEIFDTALENHEEDITLDQLEYKNKTFSIKIGSADDTIVLVDEAEKDITKEETDKTYTFKFDSDLVVVDQDDELGEKDIAKAISSEKNYSEIYIDGNYTSNGEIDIEANHDVVIKPTLQTRGVPTTTITATGDNVNYALDISGTGKVTISDLKITGGTKAELRTEDNTNVIINNIDVSGLTTPAKTVKEEIHAAIIVRGKLEANNITNTTESYALPTIALVKSYNLPSGDGEIFPDGAPENLGVNGSVTATGMTKTDKYFMVKKDTEENIDTIQERYSGEFYYNDGNNSKFYVMGLKDTYQSKNVYRFIKIYYYNDKINITDLGYTPDLTGGEGNNFVFKNLTVSGEPTKVITNDTYARDVLKTNDTTVVVANYTQKATSVLNLQQLDGLSYKNNNVSGILTNQNNDGNYYIPVTITSDLFTDNKSTVKVTNPNGESKTYTYNSNNNNGISVINNEKTMKLDLEAIKASNITNKNGKVYTLSIDVDGNENTYQEETYTIDYNDVKTLEEIINNAAKKTQDATSLTMIKNNYIKDRKENFTYKYDKNSEVTLYSENNNDIEYTFRLRKVVTDHNGPIIIALRKNNVNEGSPKINDWSFANFLTEVTKGTHEISLLQDVMKKTTLVEAIDKVKVIDKDNHKYEVTLSKDRLNDWLNNAYLDGKNKDEELDDNNTNVVLEVVLDENDEYLISMKTKDSFTVQSNSCSIYNNNQIDVKYDNINSTIIKTPIEFLSNENKTLNVTDFETFYENCKKWHKLQTGSEIYEG